MHNQYKTPKKYIDCTKETRADETALILADIYDTMETILAVQRKLQEDVALLRLAKGVI